MAYLEKKTGTTTKKNAPKTTGTAVKKRNILSTASSAAKPMTGYKASTPRVGGIGATVTKTNRATGAKTTAKKTLTPTAKKDYVGAGSIKKSKKLY